MASKSKKPFRLWSFNRLKKVSLTASSLQELKTKGCDKFSVNSDDAVTIVLEEDGTEVDEEDYFEFLPADSVMMILVGSQKWQPRGSGSVDEADSAIVFESGLDLDNDISSLLADLHKDVSNIVTFSDEQLQEIIDYDSAQLAHYFGGNSRFAKSLQEGCQRHLDDRSQTSEVINLLKTFHKIHSEVGEVDGAGEAKRRRLARDDS